MTGSQARAPIRSLHPVGRLVALVGLIVLSPVLLAVSVIIKLSSRGPVLFRATRIGQRGSTFTMYKFRTMHDRDHAAEGLITGGRDIRVFRAGRALRRAKLDELPQLANVVRGQMAIVGPRPEDPSIVHEHYVPFMAESLDVLPGLTSPGSLAYFALEGALPEKSDEARRMYVRELLPKKIALDLVYVRNRSWRYDAELVVRTLASVIGIHGLFGRHQAWEQREADSLLRAVPAESQPGEVDE